MATQTIATETVQDKESFYYGIPVTVAQTLTDIGSDIKLKQTEGLYELGEKFMQAKTILHEYKKTGWNKWVAGYAGCTQVYADQAIGVYSLGKDLINHLLDRGLSNTSLIKYASRKTTQAARDEIKRVVEASYASGEKLTVKDVDGIISRVNSVEVVKNELQERLTGLEQEREKVKGGKKQAQLDEQIAQAKAALAQPVQHTQERTEEQQYEIWMKKLVRARDTIKTLLQEMPEGVNILPFIGTVEAVIRPYKNKVAVKQQPTT
jgi:hypothetical protein